MFLRNGGMFLQAQATSQLEHHERSRRSRVQTSAPRPRNLTRFSWYPSLPPGKCRDNILNWATAASFHVISHPSFTYHPFIRRYIVWATDSVVKWTINRYIYIYIYSLYICVCVCVCVCVCARARARIVVKFQYVWQTLLQNLNPQ
jgi:hypothetical protein